MKICFHIIFLTLILTLSRAQNELEALSSASSLQEEYDKRVQACVDLYSQYTTHSQNAESLKKQISNLTDRAKLAILISTYNNEVELASSALDKYQVVSSIAALLKTIIQIELKLSLTTSVLQEIGNTNIGHDSNEYQNLQLRLAALTNVRYTAEQQLVYALEKLIQYEKMYPSAEDDNQSLQNLEDLNLEVKNRIDRANKFQQQYQTQVLLASSSTPDFQDAIQKQVAAEIESQNAILNRVNSQIQRELKNSNLKSSSSPTSSKNDFDVESAIKALAASSENFYIIETETILVPETIFVTETALNPQIMDDSNVEYVIATIYMTETEALPSYEVNQIEQIYIIETQIVNVEIGESMQNEAEGVEYIVETISIEMNAEEYAQLSKNDTQLQNKILELAAAKLNSPSSSIYSSAASNSIIPSSSPQSSPIVTQSKPNQILTLNSHNKNTHESLNTEAESESQCNPETEPPHTQSGIFERDYISSPVDSCSTYGYEILKIAFPVPFDETPHIAVSITGFKVKSQSFSLDASPLSSCVNSFTVQVHCNDDIDYIQINWLGTVSHRSGIFIYTHEISFSTQDQANTEPGLRVLRKRALHDTGIVHASAAIGFSSWSFYNGDSIGPRFGVHLENITSEGYEMIFKLWDQVMLESAKVYVLHYEEYGTTHNNVIAGALGSQVARWEVECEDPELLQSGNKNVDSMVKSLKTKLFSQNLGDRYSDSLIAWNGLMRFDYKLNAIYSLHTEVKIENKKLIVDFKKWFGAKSRVMETNLFITNTVRGQVLP